MKSVKKYLFVGFIFLLSLSSSAISVDTVISNTMQVVDSAKQSVANTLHTIDTSSLSKQVYGDVKQALAGLASALKVGVEHVYIVLVRQQVVKAIQWTIVGLIPLIMLLIFGRPVWRWVSKTADESDGFTVFIGAIFYVFCGIGLIISLYYIDVIVTGFVNPEYGAMLDIMDFIKTIKGQ